MKTKIIVIYNIAIVVLLFYSTSFSLSQIDFIGSYSNAEWINIIGVKDDIAYYCSHSNGWVEAIDFKSNPEAPKRLSKMQLQDFPSDLFIRGNYLFLTARGFYIVDISRHDSLFLCGSIGSTMHEQYHSVVVIDTIAYVGVSESDKNFGGLCLISVANVKKPYIIKKLYWDYRAAFGNFQLIDNTLYAKKSSAELVKLNLSIKDNPVIVSNIPDSGDIFLVNDTLLFRTHHYLSVYSIADFNNPKLLGQVDGSTINDMVFYNNYLYTSCEDIGLQIYNLSDPKNPQRIAESNFQGDFRGITCYNDKIYVAGAYKISVFDCYKESAILCKPMFFNFRADLSEQNRLFFTLDGKKINPANCYNYSNSLIINRQRKIATIK